MAKIAVRCFECGKEFGKERKELNRKRLQGRPHFCSPSCLVTYGNKLRSAPTIEKQCKFCGSLLKTRKTSRERSFCSRSCASLGSVTLYRREAARRSGKSNFKHIAGAGNLEAVLRARESYKYQQLSAYLEQNQIPHTFELRVGSFIFDLALLSIKTLVEFDGPEHRRPQQAEVDRLKEAVARGDGWEVVRVPSPAKTVIQPGAIEHLFSL